MDKKETVKKIFKNFQNQDTDWSLAADLFIDWTVRRDFKTESFNNFVEWIAPEQLDDLWTFFFGYGSDFERFADDWVPASERDPYLKFCEGVG